MKNPFATSPKRTPAAKAKAADVPEAPVLAVQTEKPAQPTTPAKSTTGTKAPIEPVPATTASPAPTPAKTTESQKPAKPVSAATPTKPKATQQKASNSQQPSQETINQMVEEAAYYLAEKRNFAPGFEEADWQAAKQQIMAQLEDANRPLK